MSFHAMNVCADGGFTPVNVRSCAYVNTTYGSVCETFWGGCSTMYPKPDFRSIEEWKRELERRGCPSTIRATSYSYSKDVANLEGPLDSAMLAYGEIVMNADKTSKAVLTKDRTLLEVRRGDITWKKGQKAERHTWATFHEWATWLHANGMNSTLKSWDGYTLVYPTPSEPEAEAVPAEIPALESFTPPATPLYTPPGSPVLKAVPAEPKAVPKAEPKAEPTTTTSTTIENITKASEALRDGLRRHEAKLLIAEKERDEALEAVKGLKATIETVEIQRDKALKERNEAQEALRSAKRLRAVAFQERDEAVKALQIAQKERDEALQRLKNASQQKVVAGPQPQPQPQPQSHLLTLYMPILTLLQQHMNHGRLEAAAAALTNLISLERANAATIARLG